jgi:hypothetical protein
MCSRTHCGVGSGFSFARGSSERFVLGLQHHRQYLAGVQRFFTRVFFDQVALRIDPLDRGPCIQTKQRLLLIDEHAWGD